MAETYLKQHVYSPSRRPTAARKLAHRVRQFLDAEIAGPGGSRLRFGDLQLSAVTKAHVEGVRQCRLAQVVAGEQAAERLRTEGKTLPVGERKRLARLAAAAKRAGKGGGVGANRVLSVLRAFCAWAVREGYTTETPFRRHGETVVRLDARVEGHRTRRLLPDEEARLLAACSPHLRAVVVAALSTGCRSGELLGLQWKDVLCNTQGDPVALVLPGSKTKTAATRTIPVGGRLKAVLTMLRTSPLDGSDFGPACFVFGNEAGEQVKSVKTAWAAACRRAGISDLHLHDCRREFACRLLESHAGLHDVKAFLGHGDVSTTSRYLQATHAGLVAALARMEGDEFPQSSAEQRHSAPREAEAATGRPVVN